MTIFYPDVSSFQGAIAVSGAPAVCAKVTEGTGWADGYFAGTMGRARSAGVFGMAYHFLHAGNPAGQAAWAHAHAGNVPLMLDWEPTGSSRPGAADAAGFIDAYRHSGGVCNLLYLPHWYWQQIGSPSLAPFVSRKMALVASAYTSYSDHGPGWAAYGGMDVTVWQYSDKQPFHGQRVDYNAFKGTIDQLKAIAGAGAPGGGQQGDATIRQGDKGAAVSKAQARLNVHGAARPALKVDGDFGKATHDATRQLQKTKKLATDGVIGPATWKELNKAPAAPPAPAPSPAHDTKTGPYHGAWVSAGQQSLADLAKQLGVTPNGLVRMTAVHYGSLGDQLGGYVGGLATGGVKPTDHLPKGTTVWCD